MLELSTLQQLANKVKLDLVGIIPIQATPTWDSYQEWVTKGYAGDMHYLTREDAVLRRTDPRTILPETRSILIVGASYAGPPAPTLPPLHGQVSRYAWGEDYHRWLLKRLKNLVAAITQLTNPFLYRCYVDTGPILERAWAVTAGLGWFGKNSCLVHPQLGSYLFLGVALLGIDLPATPQPTHLPACGSCTRCIDACPTGAIVAPGVIDARRCLAYLTIEHRGPIPEPLRPMLGTRVFGCDICQEVCPWNRRPQKAYADSVTPQQATLDLGELLTITPEVFRARFRKTPIWRATPEGIARNAAIVMGNRGEKIARPYLERAIEKTNSPLVREHAIWALRKITDSFK